MFFDPYALLPVFTGFFSVMRRARIDGAASLLLEDVENGYIEYHLRLTIHNLSARPQYVQGLSLSSCPSSGKAQTPDPAMEFLPGNNAVPLLSVQTLAAAHTTLPCALPAYEAKNILFRFRTRCPEHTAVHLHTLAAANTQGTANTAPVPDQRQSARARRAASCYRIRLTLLYSGKRLRFSVPVQALSAPAIPSTTPLPPRPPAT